MLLSRNAIKNHLEKGTIVISPFKDVNLGNCSYDVALGRYYYRENHPSESYTIYNPYSENEVYRVWGRDYSIAESFREWKMKHGNHTALVSGIGDDDLVIWMAPGETILGHTEEFIGGREIVTTMMKARSSIGRNFLTVCRCAGWGDVGYINRWTMEITNNSRYYHIPLVVGRRLAQLAFFQVEKIDNDDDYFKKGKYQTTLDIDELKNSWQPNMMLPRLYKDREVTN